ncbi:GntR family transcriptional regulator [Ancylobacter sp. 3268]|uniref:GntR family transcriptional regulator n=1 Tax=Ancylobacter sp. 3268 TaxID=2817752 RepID=UPI002857BD3D|nr:GntR family transcriptional regulator [Ancylobacter sp. 3268]MDR6953952.1 GntR family transcriptional regulator [Ancylobacter sp. 3268]
MSEGHRRARRAGTNLVPPLKALADRDNGLRDNGSGLPLWSQLKSALLTLIVTEKLPENARLPSESELCEIFGVSRTVVREALNQLVSERVIYKLQGKGAFVAPKRDDHGFLGSNIGFSGELHHTNHSVSRAILRQELVKPDERVRQMLGVGAHESVVALDRVLSVDGMPRILVYTFINLRLAPGFEQVPMQNRSLYDTLSRRYGIAMKRAERWLEAASATPEQAELLGIPAGAPVIAIESVTYMQTDEAVEYYTAVYRTDQARLHFIVK